MPEKSRRSRAKRSYQTKKQRARLSRPAVVAHEPVGTQHYEPPSPPKVSLRSATAPTPVAKTMLPSHPEIVTELRTIGILAGIMLTILVVLALVLS